MNDELSKPEFLDPVDDASGIVKGIDKQDSSLGEGRHFPGGIFERAL